jgi:hypothetical protein
MQHSAAGNLGRDPGRGLFGTGTTLGVLGLASLGTAIVLNATGTTNNDVVLLPCVAGGIVLTTVAHILYAVDEHNLARAMAGVFVF